MFFSVDETGLLYRFVLSRSYVPRRHPIIPPGAAPDKHSCLLRHRAVTSTLSNAATPDARNLPHSAAWVL